MKPIKWGIIGAGRISSTFATALNSLQHTELFAIASRDIDRAKKFAVRFHAQKAYESYEELARDPEIDVVYIGTPHSEHKANAALCIINGKAVLCEKPFTMHRKETEYLIALASEYKVFLMEAMWTKFLPVTQEVKKWIQEKRIGEIKHIQISMSFRSEFNINNRLYNPDTGGGALLDVGVYPITFVTHLLDKLPDRVVSSAVLGQSHVDEQNVIVFQYKEGVLANISSGISAEIGNDAIIHGDYGTIRVPSFWKAEFAERYDVSGNLVETISKPFALNGYEYEAEEVNECLREGKTESAVIPLKDTLDIISIMDGIRNEWGLTYPQERN